LKYGQLANYVPPDADALDWEVLDRLVELKHTPALLRALWDASDLPSPDPSHTQ
jgi:hypothetical protein